jgi:putative ABC transport system permease protein
MNMIAPTWTGLAYSTAPVLAALALLAVLRLGQVRPLVIGLARLTVQLALLGVVLDWLFSTNSPAIVGAIALVMLLASAHTVGSRLKGGGWALRAESFAAMGVGTAIVMAVSLRLGLRLEPWYAPRVVIPLLGMILGNSVTGVALAAERFASDLRADRDRIELRLALGATARQAATPALRSAVRAALTPVINNMMIAGIVAIPGMTTGQLLAGAGVQEAVRYQVLVYLGITGTVVLSTITLLFVRLKHYFTPWAQLRIEALGSGDAA